MSPRLAGGPSVVALGGGHGLAATLTALRTLTRHITAIVTVADDGGSSGRLRRDFPHQLPPGDLRMALATLAATEGEGGLWRDVFQYRFGHGDLEGHPIGNLVITALTELTGDPVVALDRLARLFHAAGRVLPMSTVPLEIVASVRGLDPREPDELREVLGQVNVATTAGHVEEVRLSPADPPACPEAVASVSAADWLIIGPGSWFTSVLPHLLIPDLAKAVATSPAGRVVVLNIGPQIGETRGFSAQTHLEVLAAHAPDLTVDVVVANDASSPDRAGVADAARRLGAEVVFAQLGHADGTPRHDPERLASVLDQVFATASERKGGSRRWP